MSKFSVLSQKGALNLLLLVGVVAVLGFLALASSAPFKDNLFSALFPKQSSEAAGVVDLSLVPQNVTIENNKTFLVDVVIDAKTEQPSAMDLRITYNPQVLQVVSIERGSFFTEELVAGQISSGTVTATYAQKPNAYKTGMGSVATLLVKALQPTSPTTNLTIDPNGTQIAAIGKTGNVVGLITDSTVTVTAVASVNKTAEFSFSPSSGTISAAEFPVQVMVKNSVDNANLFSAKIKYNPSLLEVSRIDLSGSFVTQWASGTDSFDNITGTVSVVGGVQNPGYKTAATPVKMATVYFRGKSSGTAALTFDGTSAVYRNSDNVDILLSSTNGSYNVSLTASPTPTPTPTPTAVPSPSALPSGTATPTPVPSPSPSPSPSPIASASAPVGGGCTLTSASWVTSANPIVENRLVNLKAVGTGNCSGQTVTFNVFEDDGVLGRDLVRNKPTSPIKFNVNNEAVASWLSEFQPDGFNGINNPPEYVFTAQITGSQTSITSSVPLLQVTAGAAGAPIKGDANRDGKLDLADMSVILTNWSKTIDIEDELDTNDDGVINTFDFAYMIQLLKLEGVIN